MPDVDPQVELAAKIATRAFELMTRRSVLADEDSDQPAIYYWPHPDRDSVVLIVDPMFVQNIHRATAANFVSHLENVLQGRRVLAIHLESGLYYRVAYVPAAPTPDLASRPLDLNAQPSPVHVPIGMTVTGDLWLSLVEMDAVLIGGARRMGKTNLLHGWIAALLQGKETRLVLFDGKGGVEFTRYAKRPLCHVVTDRLALALSDMSAEMSRRFDLLKAAGVANLTDYNRGRGAGARLERIVLVVDELAYALREPGVEAVLIDLIARGGALGIHPVLATQRPSSDVITPQLKGNLVTRIALPVPDRASSMVVMDRAGAESLVKTPGRLLIMYGARVIEAQAFQVPAIVGDEPPALPAMAELSEREARLAQAALGQGGWFKIKAIADATGERLSYVTDVAQKWQVLGWLTPVQRNERGANLGRQVTEVFSAKLREAMPEKFGENHAPRDEEGS